MSNDVYLGNPLLKKANTPIEFTQEQILEFAKCQADPVYFAKNYVKIVTLDHGLQTFKPYHFQEKLINNFSKFTSKPVEFVDKLADATGLGKVSDVTEKATRLIIFDRARAVFTENFTKEN